MRVKSLNLQEPLIFRVVTFNEVQTALEGLVLRHRLFCSDKLAVYPVMAPALTGFSLGEGIRVIRPGDLSHPWISLLAADDLVAVKFGQVAGAAVLPVVEVIGRNMGIDTGFLHAGNDRIIKWLHRRPGRVQEIIPAGLQFAAGRHTWHTSAVETVKCERFLAQTLKLRHDCPVTAVVGEKMPIQGIKHHHNCFHKS